MIISNENHHVYSSILIEVLHEQIDKSTSSEQRTRGLLNWILEYELAFEREDISTAVALVNALHIVAKSQHEKTIVILANARNFVLYGSPRDASLGMKDKLINILEPEIRLHALLWKAETLYRIGKIRLAANTARRATSLEDGKYLVLFF